MPRPFLCPFLRFARGRPPLLFTPLNVTGFKGRASQGRGIERNRRLRVFVYPPRLALLAPLKTSITGARRTTNRLAPEQRPRTRGAIDLFARRAKAMGKRTVARPALCLPPLTSQALRGAPRRGGGQKSARYLTGRTIAEHAA